MMYMDVQTSSEPGMVIDDELIFNNIIKNLRLIILDI